MLKNFISDLLKNRKFEKKNRRRGNEHKKSGGFRKNRESWQP
jgi:hypothetical protein